MRHVVDTVGMRTDDALELALDRVNGVDPIEPKPALGTDDVMVWHLPAYQVRELAEKMVDAKNLRRLLKAMIGDALKEALK